MPPDPIEAENGTLPATARATVRLNVRMGEPSTRAPIQRTVSPGTELKVAAVVSDGEAVNGNPTWYADGQENYFWDGGVVVDWGARTDE